jgi:hypothetical protein
MPKKPSKVSYQAKVGCWNCDSVYDIAVKLGNMTPFFIADKELKCKNCGCETLRMHKEYVAEKEIMKDIILHSRIEHEHEEEPPNKNHDHIQ